MTEPVIQCPNCYTSFKLNESLAAPLVKATREEYEKRLAAKDASVRQREEELAKLKDLAEDEIRDRLKAERKKIEDEAKNAAKRLLEDDMERKDKELSALKELHQSAEAKLAKSRKEHEERDAALKQKEEALERQSQELAEKAKAEAAKERRKIAEEESKKARLLLSEDMEKKEQEAKELAERFEIQTKKLAEAQKLQAEFMRKERELTEKASEMDLTIERRVNESLNEARISAKKAAEDELLLEVKQRDLMIAGMKQQIDDLKQRAESGSQQLQGEVLELELEAALRSRFPMDTIEEVKKGVSGADVLQKVNGMSGMPCGSILWETKRAKIWKNDWLSKLRDDQRKQQAEMAIIVSQTLPKEIEGFGQSEGIWICSYRLAVPVATAVRQGLIDVATARQMKEGQKTKQEQIYAYLTGPHFQQRVHAISEKFMSLQAQLQSERKWMNEQWARREKLLLGVMEAHSGLKGDIQGIAGQTFDELEFEESLPLELAQS